MKVSELTDEQLSGFIAKKLEPFAKLPKPTDAEFDLYLANNCQRWLKEFKCWEMRFVFEDGDKGGWQPRDMVNDPAMTVMLLEKLWRDPDRECYLTFNIVGLRANQYEIEITASESGWQHGVKSFVHYSEKLGRCVAEAAALALGGGEEG